MQTESAGVAQGSGDPLPRLVRTHDLVEVYRDSRLFRELRDRSLLRGKCGVCEFRELCGGCRARAFAMTGSYLESDPFCAHLPRGLGASEPTAVAQG